MSALIREAIANVSPSPALSSSGWLVRVTIDIHPNPPIEQFFLARFDIKSEAEAAVRVFLGMEDSYGQFLAVRRLSEAELRDDELAEVRRRS
jgi:hypothetical protein